MENNYYETIAKNLGAYIVAHKDSFENDEFHTITWIEQDEIIYKVCGVTFKSLGGNKIEIRTSVEAQVPFNGLTRYGRDSDGDTKLYNVFFTAYLDDGLKDVKVTDITEYSKANYDKDKSLSQSWLSYLREEKMDDYAEDFLRRNYPKALLHPMPVDPIEVANAMGLTMYYAPLGDNVFGKTYFGEEKVTIFEDNDVIDRNEIEVMTTPGTILINPDVYFMRNIGSANNTIIHECVHWDRHRKAFELLNLLEGTARHISCEIVEGEYNGLAPSESALKWMEWQANQLAPRILMPKKTIVKLYGELLKDEFLLHPLRRYAENLQAVVGKIADYFEVSHLAAKLRLIELGYEEAEGTFVFCESRGLPPYAFRKGIIDKNHSFVIGENNLIRSILMNPKLTELYAKGILVYANGMLCFNDPKYVMLNENGRYILTDYALEHVDECCFLFERKYSASEIYLDTYYRRCFLCREIDASEFVPAQYDPNHEINQTKEQMQNEIDMIASNLSKEILRMHNEMKGGFSGALNYFMDTKDITAEELQGRSGVSTVSISGYRNSIEPNIEKGTALALCKGLYLLPYQAELFLDRAGCSIAVPSPSNIYVRELITAHMDDTWQQWAVKLNMFGMAKDWLPKRNPIVKKVLEADEMGKIEKYL